MQLTYRGACYTTSPVLPSAPIAFQAHYRGANYQIQLATDIPLQPSFEGQYRGAFYRVIKNWQPSKLEAPRTADMAMA